MKIIKAIHDNPYIKHDTKYSLFVQISENIEDVDIDLIYAMLKYPTDQWGTDLDLFQYVYKDTLNVLRTCPKTFFVFNFEREGFHPDQYFDAIYANCKKYNIPPQKIIYSTSNLYDDKMLKKYNTTHNINDSINVFACLFFEDKQYNDYPIDLGLVYTDPAAYMEICNNEVSRHFTQLYCLSLSRVRRHHRTLMQFLLSEQPVVRFHTALSHSKLDDYEKECSEWDLRDSNINFKAFRTWMNRTPISPDGITFQVNKAHELSPELRFGTLFELVNETLYDNYEGGGLFYSEKTFKPMFLLQPFIIYGQQHCNRKLENYGFKLYDKLFDYSFDDEPDMEKRCNMVVQEVKRVVTHLNRLSRVEQLNWRRSCNTVAMCNLQRLIDNQYNASAMQQFLCNLL